MPLALQALTPERLASALDISLPEARKVHAQVQRDAFGQEPPQGVRRESLSRVRAETHIPSLALVAERCSQIDPFVKYALSTADGHTIETVRIPLEKPGRFSVCVSSQVGCALGCKFCATGRMGLTRNLETWEIVEQVRSVRRRLETAAQRGAAWGGAPAVSEANPAWGGAPAVSEANPAEGGAPAGLAGWGGRARALPMKAGWGGRARALPMKSRVHGVVFQGMGEPLANLDSVLEAIAVLKEPCGLAVDARNITVCTSGLPQGIRRLAREAPKVRLGLSIGSVRQEQRARLMPIAQAHPFDEVLAAVAEHARHTGLAPLWAVTPLSGVNDGFEDGAALGARARAFWEATGVRPRISVIPYNSIDERDDPFTRASDARQAEFVRGIASTGYRAHQRYSGGADVNAACGQLAARC